MAGWGVQSKSVAELGSYWLDLFEGSPQSGSPLCSWGIPRVSGISAAGSASVGWLILGVTEGGGFSHSRRSSFYLWGVYMGEPLGSCWIQTQLTLGHASGFR